jgi:site-specific DNA-methyltransferase (adenine-specific)
MNHRAAPGVVRDSIVAYLSSGAGASVSEIREAVIAQIGDVPASSVRSYLNINTPEILSAPREAVTNHVAAIPSP